MSIKLRGKNGEKKDTMRILSSDEKMFDLDGINKIVYGGGSRWKKTARKVLMVWWESVAFEKGTLDLHQESTACCSTTRPSNKTTEHHIRKNGVSWQGYMASE